MAVPVQHRVGHEPQGIDPQGVDPLLPAARPDILPVGRRIGEPHFQEGGGKHAVTPAVKQGAVLQRHGTGPLAVVKNIRPLTAQRKGAAVVHRDPFQGLFGRQGKTPVYPAVQFSNDILAEKGMKNLRRHIIDIIGFPMLDFQPVAVIMYRRVRNSFLYRAIAQLV
ncbi:MAG: hypothetical protein LBG06_11355 [Deltaproteobacteria bacterium]|nr:hypothetical protein [Deltaproteobacteria bacterium]